MLIVIRLGYKASFAFGSSGALAGFGAFSCGVQNQYDRGNYSFHVQFRNDRFFVFSFVRGFLDWPVKFDSGNLQRAGYIFKGANGQFKTISVYFFQAGGFWGGLPRANIFIAGGAVFYFGTAVFLGNVHDDFRDDVFRRRAGAFGFRVFRQRRPRRVAFAFDFDAADFVFGNRF